MNHFGPLAGVFLFLAASAGFAGPLQQANVRSVVNEVALVDPAKGERPAVVGDLVKNELGVKTGARSRAELIFQDETLTRLGPETYFSFQEGTREINLQQGTMLLQVPKNIGGARIHTAAVTASILGTTIMIEFLPGHSLKVVVLEGTLRLSLDRHFGEALLLHPGKMVIMSPNAAKIPDPVDVDLRRLVSTSRLVNSKLFSANSKNPEPPLPSTPLIDREIQNQFGLKGKSLIDTNLLITGQGSDVTLADDNQLAALDSRTKGPAALPAVTPGPSSASPSETPAPEAINTNPTPTPPVPTPTPPLPGSGPSPTPSTSPVVVPTPGTTTSLDPLPVVGTNIPLNSVVTLVTGGGTPMVTNGAISEPGTIYRGFLSDGLASFFLFGSESKFDVQIGLDLQFGTGFGGAFPTQGVAVFKRPAIIINGQPTFNTAGGPADIALISTGDINYQTGSANWDIGALHGLFLGTNAGSVLLNANRSIVAAPGSNLTYLQLFAGQGGTGDVTLGSGCAISVPDAAVIIDAFDDATLNGNTVSATTEINALKAITVAGTITSNLIQIWSQGAENLGGSIQATTVYAFGGSIALNGNITSSNIALISAGDITNGPGSGIISGNDVYLSAAGTLNVNTSNTTKTMLNTTGLTRLRLIGDNVVLTGNLDLPTGATGWIAAGSDGLNATGYDLSGFSSVMINGGNGTARNITAGSVMVTQGNLTLTGNLVADAISVGGNLTVSGAISPGSDATPLSALTLDSGGELKVVGGLNFAGANSSVLLTAPQAGYQLTITSAGSVTFSSSAINGANFNGGDATLLSLAAGADGGTLNIGTTSNPVAGDVTINSPISATTGANALLVTAGGNGGTVNIDAAGTVNVNSSVKVSDRALGKESATGGNVSITSRQKTGTAISVSNSGQILALLAATAPGPGGTIKFTSAGGNINLSGGTVEADRGTIVIQNNGAGNISLTNANLSASVFKAETLGANGQLTINGGTISANNAIELYAAGSNGTVLFNGNVTLSGNSVKTIAGDTVTISQGKTVTIGGSQSASVYTNQGNYTGSGGNASTTGKFGGAGATTHPFANRPTF